MPTAKTTSTKTKAKATKKVAIPEEDVPDSAPAPAPAPVSVSAPAPRKRKTVKKKDEEVQKAEEHIVVQLPIQPDRVHTILEESNVILNPLEYSAKITEPEPYAPSNQFESCNDEVYDTSHFISNDGNHKRMEEITRNEVHIKDTMKNCCYWCCHPIPAKEFGLPIKYDTIHKTFTTFGSFCSLECVVAHNYSHHMGSDRMWEIHSWIQWMAQKMGYETPVRPAPNRYLLKMFNGSLDIQEFREVHKSYMKSYIMNTPPLIHMQGQMEILNTSYLNQHQNQHQRAHVTTTTTTAEQPAEKMKLTRKKAVMDMKKTLDSKMNLTVKPITTTEMEIDG